MFYYVRNYVRIMFYYVFWSDEGWELCFIMFFGQTKAWNYVLIMFYYVFLCPVGPTWDARSNGLVSGNLNRILVQISSGPAIFMHPKKKMSPVTVEHIHFFMDMSILI